jgi:peptide/nickel transport system ATP-binding protein
MPRLSEIPKGCAFNPRCDSRGKRCLDERPDLMSAGASRAACWLHDRGGVGAPVAKELADA